MDWIGEEDKKGGGAKITIFLTKNDDEQYNEVMNSLNMIYARKKRMQRKEMESYVEWKMKLKDGRTYYKQDLNNYNSEFLQDIILELLEELEDTKNTLAW